MTSRHARLAMALVFVSSAIACARRPDTAAERRAILRTDSAWLAAAQSRNADSTATFWTDDGRVIGPGQAPTVGKAAIRKMLHDGFAAPAFSVSWHTSDVVVAPNADIAYSFGTNVFTVPTAPSRVDTLRGQGVVVWRKDADGRWRAAVDTWTPRGPQ